MAETPARETSVEPQYSPAVQRLADRYGMSPDAIEQIIAGTSAANPTMPRPVAPAAEAAREGLNTRASRMTGALGSSASGRPSTGPGLPIAIAILLLIGLGVALSFKQGCFRQREMNQALKPNISDTLQTQQAEAANQASQPPTQPSAVAPPQVPPEALVAPRETPPGTTGPTSNAGPTTFKQAETASKSTSHARVRRPVATTSSYLEAEERLAELRANGNQRARIVTKGSGAKRSYVVYSR